MPVRPSDPTDPAFPHGTAVGNQRGCHAQYPCPASPTCVEQRRRQVKRNALQRRRGVQHVIDASEVISHIESVKETEPDVITDNAITAMTGMSNGRLAAIRRTRRVSKRNADVLLAVTAEQVLAYRDVVPAARARHLMRTLQAAGFPMAWTEREAGLTYLRNTLRRPDQRVLNGEAWRKLAAVAERVGFRDADPGLDGIRRGEIVRAKREAADLGYYPAAAYDDEGRLDFRLLPGHPWALAGDLAGRQLDIARCLLAAKTVPEIEAELRTELVSKRVERMKARLGLRYDQRDSDYFLTEECRPAADRLRAALDLYDQGEDPVLICLRLGLMGVRGPGAAPSDHPAYARYAAEVGRIAPLAA